MGLVFSWLRAVHPTLGRIPEAVVAVLPHTLAILLGVIGTPAGPR